MAKRKAGRLRKASAGQARRKASAKAGKRSVRKAAGSRKASARPARRKTAAKRTVAARTAAPRRKALKRTAKPAVRKSSAGKAPTRKATARKAPAAARNPSAGSGLLRASSRGKVPALNRERRIVRDEDIVPSPPSSLDLDRSASSARSGRRELSEKFHDHTETSPAITGGDIDADWESAYSVGDEAPGGDNPTPDQDIVDDIGKALGVQYEDNEELKGEKKISDRDKKRWELDPASAEDYNEHDED